LYEGYVYFEEIWAQDIGYIMVGTLLGHLSVVLAPNFKQHILSQAKVM
jgi:hypothetical protein